MIPSNDTAVSPPASGDTSPSKFELGVSLILHNWQALSTAVAEQWGGPESADKRDWLAGAIADFCSTQPLSDAEDVEDMLLQIMEDEYEVVVEDGSEAAVARDVVKIRDECGRGDYGTVDELLERWRSKMGTNLAPAIIRAGPRSDDEESVDDEDWVDGEDIQMVDAAAEQPRREKPTAEVDDDGFTKVVGKKKR